MRKKTKEHIKIMVTKSFDYLRKNRVGIHGVHVMNFLDWWQGLNGLRRPSCLSCLLKYNTAAY